MFNSGCQPTIMKSALESANLELESADLNIDSGADLAKVSVWVQALSPIPRGGWWCRWEGNVTKSLNGIILMVGLRMRLPQSL